MSWFDSQQNPEEILKDWVAATPSKTLDEELRQQLADNNLERIIPNLEAIGVRTKKDVPFVSDDDLLQWSFLTIDRRRFNAFKLCISEAVDQPAQQETSNETSA